MSKFLERRTGSPPFPQMFGRWPGPGGGALDPACPPGGCALESNQALLGQELERNIQFHASRKYPPGIPL